MPRVVCKAMSASRLKSLHRRNKCKSTIQSSIRTTFKMGLAKLRLIPSAKNTLFLSGVKQSFSHSTANSRPF